MAVSEILLHIAMSIDIIDYDFGQGLGTMLNT